MSPRTQQRASKGRDRDRADRRAVVDVLLARAQRGVLSTAEGALLGEHAREEQRVADENRRAMAGTTQALERTRAQLAAAEAAIVEAERDRDQAEERATEARRVAGDQAAAVARVVALVGRHNAVPAEAVWAAVDADPVEHRTADDRARQWKAEQGAALDAVSRVRVLAQRMRAGSPQGAAAIYADRIEQALDNDRRALDPDTAIRAQFLAAADSTTARLAEQKREHDVALATAEERARRLGATMQRTVDHYREQVVAVRAALPDEPRPRLGLPTDLAYANGRHDLAEQVRYVLDQAQQT
ncbi:hypothetical protein [Streptomyces sp. f51]|uniref:hypothetical protein n=1 Tax=Streptomyces sp. f51 TaxID=1827742 RepID=UPI000BEF8A61|nr:hypothetical protein [Streptomyces sp. f51]